MASASENVPVTVYLRERQFGRPGSLVASWDLHWSSLRGPIGAEFGA